MLTLPKNQIPPHLRRFFKPRHVFKPKDDLMIPHRVYDALMADGWYGRADIVWEKPNAMPSSVQDRPTTAHEYIFLLAKQPRYFYDAAAIAEPSTGQTDAAASFARATKDTLIPGQGYTQHRLARETTADTATRNKRSVWTIPTAGTPLAHFACWPEALVRPMVLAGTSAAGGCAACGAAWRRVVDRVVSDAPTAAKGSTFARGKTGVNGLGRVGGAPRTEVLITTGWAPACRCRNAGPPQPQTILDPFAGSGTTLAVAQSLGRAWRGCELNSEYAALVQQRIAAVTPYWDAPAPLPVEDFGPLFANVGAA